MIITHIIDSAGLYGAEKVLLELCTQQKKQGHLVNLISIGKKNDSQKEIEASAISNSIDTYTYRTNNKFSLKDVKDLRTLITSLNSDILHSHSYKSNIIAASMVNSSFGKVSTLHGYTGGSILDPIHLYELADKLSLFFLDKAISVAPDTLPRFFSILLRNKFAIIPNGIDFSAPTKEKSQQDRPCKLICIGRLSKEKNISLAIDAMEILAMENPQLSMEIYGDGPQKKLLQKMINDKNLNNKISLKGFSADIESALHNADLLVNCSTTEGLPISLLECMKAKTNFIASNIENIRNIIPSTLKNEILFNPNKAALIGSIKLFLSKSKRQRMEIAEELYSHTKEHYSSDIMLDRYLHQYETVLKIGDK